MTSASRAVLPSDRLDLLLQVPSAASLHLICSLHVASPVWDSHRSDCQTRLCPVGGNKVI